MQLRLARRQAGLTQAQLAHAAGIDQQTVSRIERGETRDPSHRIVMAISRALGLNPSEIDEFENGGSL
jgi:transcriptional regulator with XRE-family HTH domain